MALGRAEREALIDRYADGPSRLKAALAKVPAGALQWRPKAGEWSAHEIVVHCADSETNAHARQIEDNVAAWRGASGHAT